MTGTEARRWRYWLMAALVTAPALAGPKSEIPESALDPTLKNVVSVPPADWSAPPVEMATYKPAAKDVLTPPAFMAGAYELAKTPPVLDWAILPGQWRGGALWSSWGDALYASDGNFYCSIGDHHAPYGHSYIYRVNPKTRKIDLVVDFTKVLGTKFVEGGKTKELYAPGKIHGPLVEHGGWIYFSGYRGGLPYTTDKQQYDGDPLICYELATGKVENLGIPVPEVSHAAYRVVELDGKLCWCGLVQGGEDIGGNKAPENFFVYNIADKKLVYYDGPKANAARAFIITADGRAYYSTTLPPKAEQTAEYDKKVAEAEKGMEGNKRKDKLLKGAIKKIARPTGPSILVMYDPKANKVVETKMVVPDDGVLRAATRVASNGIAYCVTVEGTVFSVDTNRNTIQKEYGRIVPKGGNGYTPVAKLDPTERYVYLLPGAHGLAHQDGSVVLRLDVATGKLKALAFLNDYFRGKEHYNLGGAFGTALSDDGSTLFINWNGRPLDKQVSVGSKELIGFDLCSVMMLHIPESDR